MSLSCYCARQWSFASSDGHCTRCFWTACMDDATAASE